MRLLLITRAHSQSAGGMERLSFELISAIRKLPAVETTTLIRSGTSRLGAIFFVLKSIPRALQLARRADVVHVGDPVLSLHAWLIRKLLKKPVAVTIHGLDVTYRNPLYQFYLQLFGEFDLTLSISEHAQQLLKKSRIRTSESRVIPPGVHDRYFDPMLARSDLQKLLERTSTYNLSPTTSVLLTTGRLVKRKGHAWFIEHVLPHLPANTVYVIAGDGPEKETIKETVRRLGFAIEGHAEAERAGFSAAGGESEAEVKAREYAGRATPGPKGQEPMRRHVVLLLGRVSDDDLRILYNTVDAFVQPNISVPGDAEGFGLVLLEAALCERPVFANRLDGIPDAIHDQKNGTLLPAGDAQAWIKALTAKPLAPNPAARAYTLQNFSWPVQAQKYADELRRLVR